MCWKFPEVFLKPWAFWTSAETLVKDSAPIGDAETASLGGAKKNAVPAKKGSNLCDVCNEM